MNRGRLFATIEHIERGLARPKRPGAAEHSSPPPVSTPRERAERLSRPVLTASPAALVDAAGLGQIELPQGKAAPLFVIEADGRE